MYDQSIPGEESTEERSRARKLGNKHRSDMSVNSSSSDDTNLPLHNSSISNLLHCIFTRPTSFIISAFNITNILFLLPLSTFILHHGLQLWRQRKRSASSAATVSHCDCFTYHMVVMELVRVVGCAIYCFGVYSEYLSVIMKGTALLFTLTLYGQMFFHVLTCVERYLAVVHPITYLNLKNERGLRIRNIIIGCVWLLCFAGMGWSWKKDLSILNFCTSLVSLTVISFCSLSVLCVLIRPGPGEQGGSRARVDQSKLRAFYTIVSILGVLLVKFSYDMVWGVYFMLEVNVDCEVIASGLWVTLPSSLVLPLLFLHRAGKLMC